MRSSKTVLIGGLFCVILVVGLAYFLLHKGFAAVVDIALWRDHVKISSQDRLPGLLFRKLRDARLVELTDNRGWPDISVADCGTLDRGEAGNTDDLLEHLCSTETGESVRNEIARWRADQINIAVRDDAAAPAKPAVCAPEGARLGASYYARCRTNPWRVWRAMGGTLVEVRRGPTPDPAQLHSFGLMGLQHPFQDWVSPSVGTAPANLHAQYRFATDLILVPGHPVHIQIAGALAKAVFTASNRSFTLSLTETAPQPIGVGAEAIVVQPRPQPWASSNDTFDGATACDVPPPAVSKKGLPQREMSCLVLRSRDEAVFRVTLDIMPIEVNECVRSGTFPKDGKPCRLHTQGPIAAACAAPSHCKDLDWKEVPNSTEAKGRLPCSITDRTGIRFTDVHGDITPGARKAGLGPVIGLGPEDPGSLSAAVFGGNRDRECDLRTTISLDAQSLVQRALESARADLLRNCTDTCRLSRAEVIIMDAGDRPGQILAVGSVPATPDRPFHLWDAQASLAEDADNNNPMRRYGWRETDPQNMPGSAFKLFTAIAAIDSAERHTADIQSYIEGRPANEVLRFLKVENDVPPVSCHNRRGDGKETSVIPDGDPKKSYCIHNSEGEPLQNAADVTGCNANGNIGLCGALAISSNIWFGKIASVVDGDRLMQSDGWERTDFVGDLALRRAVQRLTQQDGRTELNLIAYSDYHASSLFMHPIVIDAENGTNANRRELLALAGFGQNVSASPLALATAYGGLGCGAAIRPHFDLPRGEEEDCAHLSVREPLFGDWDAVGLEDIAILKEGLRAVVTAGTASKFATEPLVIERRVFAKTATAIPNKDIASTYSSGFVGWLEPAAGNGVHDRLAFACRVTWTHEMGASACGPIVFKLLAAFDAHPRILHLDGP